MTMFQTGNFAVLDENANRVNLSAYHQQFTPVSSPVGSSLSEDQVSIKSVNQFALEPNGFEETSYQSFERKYEDSSFADDACQLIDQYAAQADSQTNGCNEVGVCDEYGNYTNYEAFAFDSTRCKELNENCSYDNGCSQRSTTEMSEDKQQEEADQFMRNHFDLEQLVSQQLLGQQPVDPPSDQQSASHPIDPPQSLAIEPQTCPVKPKTLRQLLPKQASSQSTAIEQALSSEPKSNSQDTKKRIPRPANAFMIFGQQNRKILASQNPNCTNKQISKMLGDKWRSMSKEEKSRFHALADEAHKKHLMQYPGYYYSPLEARMAKADRKKKHYEKINSKRGYCKQSAGSPATSQMNGDVKSSIQPSHSAAFFSSMSFGGPNKPTNESNTQAKHSKQQQQVTENAVYQNSKLSSSYLPICASSTTASTQSLNFQRATIQSSLQPHQSICHYHTANHPSHQLKQNSKFDPNRFAQNQPDSQPSSHSIQLNRNVLFSSQTVQNNVMQLLSLPNGNENDLMDNGRFFNPNFNNFGNFSNHSFNGPLYHHHASGGYPVPTVFHVTSKDPNLNSTLSTADTAFASISPSNSSSISNSNSSMNPMANDQSYSHICTNQFMQQQTHHQQSAPKSYGQTDGCLSLFLPQIDSPTIGATYSTNH